jgi:23S rRNA pseudouridine2605 synthase
MATAEVREVRGRVLKDQLGEKLARAAGADFSAPVRQREEPPTQRPAGRRGPAPAARRGRHADRRRKV